MYTQAILYALAIVPLVSAHGKIAVVTGDLGGNGTGLGIRGAAVAGAGPNYLTEVDTTVFWSSDITTDDDIGYTDEAGKNHLSDLDKAMELSGNTLPQVSSGGSIKGTYHIVTSDGAGPLEALVDETATAKWSEAKSADVTTQVPGDDGWISTSNKRDLMSRMVGSLAKRRNAVNVNKDYPFAIDIPSGTSCSGTVNGLKNVCLVKVSNNNENGPFGGVFAVQMPSSSSSK
ncbi:uncharacterized protein TRUGW13939_09107 [Talaromyces rugulosus]|uniref:Cell surface protein n=1 Tax=Talaromyces rugulosus TaxID=121627 RepID=A0A7H8R866_TALRU|nr:uncharacterized protein TRUGW13939_09107 [Talaromyces rugulosus]QKX61951.1 hypothetical protein TRUGW13939_09107 [Talaromyces rugulosus]